jgi:magnesium transporter
MARAFGPTPPMVMFSELRGFHLRDEQHQTAMLSDLVLDLGAGEYPVGTHVLFRRRGRPAGELPWSAVRSIDLELGRILVADLDAVERDGQANLKQAVLLDRDVMDALIIDLPRRQSMRANDLWIEEIEGRLLLRAADISPWAVIRRLGHGFLGHGVSDRRLLDWRDVEFLRGDPLAAREGRDYHRRVATLQPPEIARLLDAVPYLHAAELLTLISDDLAADTLEVMQPARQVQVFEELDDDQQLRLLQLMAPDNIADLLDGLGPEPAGVLLNRLPEQASELVVELLGYPADTAGGIMTNDLLVVVADLDVIGARQAIRPDLVRSDFDYYVYVVDTLETRTLLGVLTLRDLLLADDRDQVREVMRKAIVTLDPLVPAIDAARAVAAQHLAALPVVGRDGRLIGAVTADSALVQIEPQSLSGDTPRIFT